MRGQLEAYFDAAFTAPDGIKRLRELILTLAVQGKLTDQRDSDEPASELLKKIAAEKKKRRIQLASATPSKLNEKARWYSPLASPSNQRLRGVWAMHTLPGKNGTTSARQ